MPSGGGSSQTTTSEPWSGQKPFLEYGFGQAQDLYQGGTPNYYPNATYTPLTEQNLAGIDAQSNRALYGSPYEQLGLGMTGRAASGADLYSNPMYGLLGGTAAGMDVYNDPRWGMLGGLASGGNVGYNPANPALAQMAYGGAQNPYLNDMFDQASSRVGDAYKLATAPSTMLSFQGAGRSSQYGTPDAYDQFSGLQRRELGDRLNDLATNMYGGQYQADQNRSLQAAGQLGGLYSNDISQMMGAAGQLGSAYQFGEGNRLGTAGQLGNQYSNAYSQMLGAAGALPGMSQQVDYGNISQLLGAGDMLRGFDSEVLQDDINRFNFGQNVDWQKLQQYMGLVGGGGYGGTQTTSGSQSIGPGQILGGGLSLLGSALPFMFSCWVAREVYGIDNPDWLRFRHWMLNIGPKWFRKLYLKHGEKFAGWLKRHPRFKGPIRRWMDSRIKEA